MINTFFILLYGELFEIDTLFSYFKQVFACTKSNSLRTYMIKQKYNSNLINNIFLPEFIDYIYWIENEKYITYYVSTPVNKKYEYLGNTLQNIFLNKTQKRELVTHFGKINRHYLAFCRFAYLWKYKHAETAVTTDLYFNEIDDNQSNRFVLFQNKTKYIFIVSDLLRTIQGTICKDWEDDYTVPQKPINPYNKMELKPHHYYNLYFHMRFNMLVVIPELFHIWFLNDFDLAILSIKYDKLITKLGIYNHVQSATDEITVYNDVRDMLNENRYTKKWTIHPDFPRKTLINIMRPYLYLYYLIQYDVLNCEERVMCMASLGLYLGKFYKYNEQFGRRTLIKLNKFPESKFNYKNMDCTNFKFGENNLVEEANETTTEILETTNICRAIYRFNTDTIIQNIDFY